MIPADEPTGESGRTSLAEKQQLVPALQKIVGTRHVLTGTVATRAFAKGHRTGGGPVLAVVRPGSLWEQWQVLELLIAANCIVIMQAANTGLTGGSTPDGNNYDREVVLLNTLRITGVQVINKGSQVVCLPGATLNQLEQTLAPFDREPHSVIGSSCIGASVLGGVCNNSGGALVRRGPAYTQLALYAQMQTDGKLRLVNHLGIKLGETPEEILKCLEKGSYTENDVIEDPSRLASDSSRYSEDVRKIDADTPARFNADPTRLFEASGSAGKLCLFAVRLDTFPKEASTTFYIGTNEPDDLTGIRRHLLTNLPRLPIAGEYIHRTAYDIGERYGKDTFLLIEHGGTSKVSDAFAFKSKVDGFFERFGINGLTDRVLQGLSQLFPSHLPKRMKDWRDKYEHHLLLRISNDTLDATKNFLGGFFLNNKNGAYFQCNEEEGRKAFLHRFAIAGAAIRYRAVHHKVAQDIVALDIALRRNDRQWVEKLPEDIECKIIHKLYYGHFFCHVFHQDYIIKKGVDPIVTEHRLWEILEERKAEYPAEHNVGHLYIAKPSLTDFYKKLDPNNSFNPGIGQTSRLRAWGNISSCGECQQTTLPSSYSESNNG